MALVEAAAADWKVRYSVITTSVWSDVVNKTIIWEIRQGAHHQSYERVTFDGDIKHNFNVLFISERQKQKIALWAQQFHQLPQDEVHTHGHEPEPDARPEVHEDAGPLLSV